MLPTLADGTPLCELDDLRREPHAWVKLWKHHAAQPEADRINAVAAERAEPWLAALRRQDLVRVVLREGAADPRRGAGALRACCAVDRGLLTGSSGSSPASRAEARVRRGTRRCGRSATGSLHPRTSPRSTRASSTSSTRSCRATLLPPGARAGGLSERAAAWTGLRAGTPVAVGNVDFHGSVPATTVTAPGTLVMIMGTSNGHLLLGDELVEVEGMCGVVEDGIVPGYFGYEAGQSALGDIFAWFARARRAARVPRGGPGAGRRPPRRARRGGGGASARASPACSRSTGGTGTAPCSSTPTCRGCSSGMTLATRAARDLPGPDRGDGVRHACDRRGVRAGRGSRVDSIVACGGLPSRNPLLMQIFADVTEPRDRRRRVRQAPALGAAMWGAVAAGAAAGGHATIADASRRMARLSETRFRPATGASGSL